MKSPPLHFLGPVARLLFAVLLMLTVFMVLFFISAAVAAPLFGLSFTGMLGLAGDLSYPGAVNILKYFQVVQEFGLFIIPPLLAALFFATKPAAFLSLDLISRWQLWLLTLLIMASSIPVIHQLIQWNEAMHLPEWLKGVEGWMQQTETQAREITEAFLEVTTTGGFLFNILMIAILPAIGEELLFRGLLQRLFHDWFGNIHMAILITAFLFGAMHLQFYGLLPRMVLGILFGYLLWWSRSLWIPIFAHFLNNAVAVTIAFLENRGYTDTSFESFGSSDSLFFILGNLVVCLASLYVFFYLTRPTTPVIPNADPNATPPNR